MLAGPCYIPYGTLPNVRGMRTHFTTVDRMPVGGILQYADMYESVHAASPYPSASPIL